MQTDLQIIAKQVIESASTESLREFMQSHGHNVDCSVPELSKLVLTKAGGKSLPVASLVDFLDRLAAGNRQHVILLRSTKEMARVWRNNAIANIAKLKTQSSFSDEPAPVELPKTPTISAIEMRGNESIAIRVIDTFTGQYRDDRLDYEEVRGDDHVFFKGYREQTRRITATFNWNLLNGKADLRIGQLPSGIEYESARKLFQEAVAPAIRFDLFDVVSVAKAIAKVHANALNNPDPEVRVQLVDYESPGGRKVMARGRSTSQDLLTEPLVTNALDGIREHGKGRMGNFYWNPNKSTPFDKPVHVVVLAESSRINFPTDHDAATIDYILAELRKLS